MMKTVGMKKMVLVSIVSTAMGISGVPVAMVNAEVNSCEENLQKILDKENAINKSAMEISEDEINALEEYEELEEVLEENPELESHYSGAYIDDNDELVVVLENDCSKEVVEDIEKIDEDIEIKYAQYTLEELERAKENITQQWEKNYEILNCVNAVYVDEENNCIVVDIIDITNEKIDLFKEYISSDVNVIFNGVSQSEITNEEATTLKGGQAIYAKIGGVIHRGSIGFRAKTSDGKYYGFVTAGHFGKLLGLKVYADISCKNQIGIVARRQFSGSVDGAFVRITNSKYQMGNSIYYRNINLNSVVANPVQGATVYKSGSTTGWTRGKVRYTNYNTKYSGVSFKNLAKADYASKSGDSGGTVYEPFYALKSPYTTVEVHVASGGIFVKSNNILSALKLKRY